MTLLTLLFVVFNKILKMFIKFGELLLDRGGGGGGGALSSRVKSILLIIFRTKFPINP